MKRLLKLAAVGMAAIFVFNLSFADNQAGDAKTTPPEKGKAKVTEYKKRLADNPEIAIDTDFGTMKLELFRDVAPGHVDSMLSLIRKKFYDGLTFHRVIDGFMIQGGDPNGNGSGDAGYQLKAEFSKLPHIEGTLSMARSNNPNSASCQFFICLAPAQYLDGKYTVFGHLMDGLETLHKIGSTPVAGEKPVKDVVIRKMRILKDITPKGAGQ